MQLHMVHRSRTKHSSHIHQRCHSRHSLIPWPLRTLPPFFLPSFFAHTETTGRTHTQALTVAVRSQLNTTLQLGSAHARTLARCSSGNESAAGFKIFKEAKAARKATIVYYSPALSNLPCSAGGRAADLRSEGAHPKRGHTWAASDSCGGIHPAQQATRR